MPYTLAPGGVVTAGQKGVFMVIENKSSVVSDPSHAPA